MTEEQKKIKRYVNAIERNLKMPLIGKKGAEAFLCEMHGTFSRRISVCVRAVSLSVFGKFTVDFLFGGYGDYSGAGIDSESDYALLLYGIYEEK